MNEPQINPKQAVDVEKAAADLAREAQEAKQHAESVAKAHSWERAMNRAFKGVMPRRERHAMLDRAVDRVGE